MQTRRSRGSKPENPPNKRVYEDAVSLDDGAKRESEPDSVVEATPAKLIDANSGSSDGMPKDGTKPLHAAKPGDGAECYQNRESILMSHWLFADEGSGFKPPKMGSSRLQPSGTATFATSNLFTSAAKVAGQPIQDLNTPEPSQEPSTALTVVDGNQSSRTDVNSVPSAFAFASGRPCPMISADEMARMKRMLELDNLSPANTNCSDNSSGQPARREEVVKVSERTYATTDKVVDYIDTTNTHRITVVESWCRNCVLTNHDGSSLSPSMLSRMWNIYGNPFTVTYKTSAKFTFIKYSPCEDSITVGGMNEIYQCFRQILRQHAHANMVVQRFDSAWMRNRYCLYTSCECRRFRKSVFKLIRGGKELKDAILEVQLPNPLTVIKKILWCFNQEYDGKDSILLRVLHGDAPADSPVVVRVESIKDDDVCITDGQSILRSIAADCYVRHLIKNKRINIGSKIMLHGVAIDADASKDEESAVVKLNCNSISPAPRRPLGLQNMHGNSHIRELKGGGGKVAQLDVTVLAVMPQMYKVFYKSTDSSQPAWVFLSEWEFNEQFTDPMNKPPVEVENVYQLQTLTVIDTIILLRIKDYLQDPLKFQKALVKSCALLTLRNVDETMMSMIRSGSRLKVTHLTVQNASTFSKGHIAPRRYSYIGNYLSLHSTTQSRMDIKDRDTPLHQIRRTVSEYKQGAHNVPEHQDEGATLGEAKTIFRTLILGEPALSISSQNEAEFFELLREEDNERNYESEEMFLDQFCNVTGVLIDVGDITNTGGNWHFFRFFVLTTCFKMVAIKVAARSPYPFSSESRRQNTCAVLEYTHRRLMSHRLTIARTPEATSRKNKAVFVAYMNIQYAGFDQEHGVYNFNTTPGKLVLRESNVLQMLQARLNNGLIFASGTGSTISYDAVAALGDTEIERDCRAFARELARGKIKACQLLNTSGEEVELCEELSARSR